MRALVDLEVEYMMNRPCGDDSGQFRDVWRSTLDSMLARKRALQSGRPPLSQSEICMVNPRVSWRSKQKFETVIYRFLHGADTVDWLASAEVIMEMYG